MSIIKNIFICMECKAVYSAEVAEYGSSEIVFTFYEDHDAIEHLAERFDPGTGSTHSVSTRTIMVPDE